MNSKLREKYSLKQMNIEIPEELHEEIKRKAKCRNITMRRWILRHLLRALKSENP